MAMKWSYEAWHGLKSGREPGDLSPITSGGSGPSTPTMSDEVWHDIENFHHKTIEGIIRDLCNRLEDEFGSIPNCENNVRDILASYIKMKD